MYEWVSKMTPANFRATILQGVPMREAPSSSAPSFTLGESGRTIDFIGEVPDLGGGSIPYIVYALGSGGLRCTRKDNIEGAITPLGVATTTEVIKEVIVEVPTGISEADVQAARENGINDEKARVRAVLGL